MEDGAEDAVSHTLMTPSAVLVNCGFALPERKRRQRVFRDSGLIDAGCFVGLQPGRRNSGESEPLLVQGAHYILGPFGENSDLRRWGHKLAARGETGGGGRV
jgi:hypothetical protein